MKRKIVLVIIVIIAICIFTIVSFANEKESNAIQLDNPILANYQLQKYDTKCFEVEILEELEEIPEVEINSYNLMQFLNKDINNSFIKNELIYDSFMERECQRIVYNDYEIEIDNGGHIVKYKNYEDYSVVDKSRKNYMENEILPEIDYLIKEEDDLRTIISKIESVYNLEGYEQIACNGDVKEAWIISWCKKYGDIYNPYECFNITIDSKDGSVISFGRNDLIPNSIEPLISNNQAKVFAQEIIEKINSDIKEIELSFVKANFYWLDGGPYKPTNFIRLAWIIRLQNESMIYIDARTGEILGGSETLSTDYGRAMQVVDGFGKIYKVNAASGGLTTLGFNQTGYVPVTWSITQTDIDWVLSRPNLYGLYLCCHGIYLGNECVLGDDIYNTNNTWEIHSTSSFGNWHLVCLDACQSSKNALFAYSFNTVVSGTAFTGWNNSISQTTSYAFYILFWNNYIGTETVLNALLDARQDCLDAGMNSGGSNYCNPGFAGDSNYWGWAW